VHLEQHRLLSFYATLLLSLLLYFIGQGPFTLLAPNNEAFNLSPETRDALFNNPTGIDGNDFLRVPHSHYVMLLKHPRKFPARPTNLGRTPISSGDRRL